jgi:hypothetical protein
MIDPAGKILMRYHIIQSIFVSFMGGWVRTSLFFDLRHMAKMHKSDFGGF